MDFGYVVNLYVQISELSESSAAVRVLGDQRDSFRTYVLQLLPRCVRTDTVFLCRLDNHICTVSRHARVSLTSYNGCSTFQSWCNASLFSSHARYVHRESDGSCALVARAES